MAKIKDTDLLLVNRGGVDHKAPKSELGIPTTVAELSDGDQYVTIIGLPDAIAGGDALDEYALKTELPTDNKDLANGANYITIDEVPEVDLDPYALKTEIPTDNASLTNGAGYITADDVEIEGALVFRGNVVNEGALPGDAVQGDLYYNEDDNHLYAKGDSGWHKVGQVDDVDLSLYALKTEIPTDNADLANGANYITLAEVPEVDLDDYALKTELPTDNADLANGAGYITVEALPKDVSDLNNDLGFITLSDLPDRVTIDELPELEG